MGKGSWRENLSWLKMAGEVLREKREIFDWIFFCAKGLGEMSLLDNRLWWFEWWECGISSVLAARCW
jgi:hypothetical protein